MAEAKPKKPADKGSRSRSWFIVCPNVRTHGVAGAKPEDIVTWTAQEICDFVVAQWVSKTRQAACLYCKSAEGLEHLHIVLCDVNKAYFNTVKKFIGGKAHIEMTKGSKAQVEEYINKTGKFEEKGEVVLAKAQEGELIGKQGDRTDVQLIREAIENGFTWKEVRRMDDRFFENKYTTMIKNMYFDKRSLETPFKRSVAVHWYIGESGSGKTGITLDLVETLGEEQLYMVSDYKNGFDSYSGEPILVLDEFRGQLQYAVLLGILEGYKKELPARYSNVLGLWNEVHITTIKTPEQVYAKMIDSAEADEDPISQLLGRIADITYCYKVNRTSGTKKDRNGNPAEFYRCTIPGEMYRNLKFDKEMGDKIDQLKQAAKVEYLMKYYQPGDIVEAFGISPAEPTSKMDKAL